MTSQARKDLEAQFAIGLESAAALSAQGKSVCCVISEDRSDGTVIVRMHPEFRGRLQYGTELYVSAEPKPVQQTSMEICGHQFQGCDGKWCNFINEEHYRNTVADGSWPIREIYTAVPQPVQQPTPRYEPTDEGIGND